MNELDDRIRRLVRAIGEAAPEPPALRSSRLQLSRARGRGPLVAVFSFVVIAAVFVVFRLVFGDSAQMTTPVDGAGGSVVVRHQVVEFTIAAELFCDQATGPGITNIHIEVWADFEGGRFRQQATYVDGSIRDVVALGDLDYPIQTYGRGDPQLEEPACDGQPEGGDPTAGPNITFFNPPFKSPNVPGYEDLGTLIPGDHRDSLGRPSLLCRQTVDGSARLDDGTGYVIHQVTDWHVDETSGDVLETSFVSQGSGHYDLRQTMVVVSDQETSVDSSIFDTAGYQLEWDGDGGEQGLRVDAVPIGSSITLGTEVIWPNPLEPAGPKALGKRFAAEVLGWENATVTLDPAGGASAPTWVTVDDGNGRQLAILTSPNRSDGWGVIQIGERAGIGSAPLGYASINPAAVAGATQIVIHASSMDGSTLAWQAQLTDSPRVVVLPGIQVSEVMTLLVTYQDADGETLTASGGQFGGP